MINVLTTFELAMDGIPVTLITDGMCSYFMRKGLIYAILTALVFTTLEPVSKLIAHQVTPYAITFWRFIIGSVLLLPFAIIKIRKENIHITLKDIGIMTLMGAIFVCIIMVALQSAVKVADSPSIISMIFPFTVPPLRI